MKNTKSTNYVAQNVTGINADSLACYLIKLCITNFQVTFALN